MALGGRGDAAGGHGTARRRGPAFAPVYVAAVLAFTTYVLLDVFVIQRSYRAVADTDPTVAQAAAADTSDGTGESSGTGSSATGHTHVHGPDGTANGGTGSSGTASGTSGGAGDSTGTSDSGTATTSTASGNVSDASATQVADGITLTTERYLGTTVYVVDLRVDATSLRTALANDTYGRNVTQTTSQMAQAKGATVAINGDFYGARNAGYVVRNGTLYRDTVASSSQEDLVIYANGSFDIVREGDVSAQELVDAGAWQVFSFGPALVDDGSVAVSQGDEVDQAMASNPRTAIGQVGEGHYVLVVSDGRTSESAGLSLYQLATFMHDELGVTCAYNLDGGGSSTLCVNGSVVNNPTGGGVGSSSGERSVSDIVYVAV